MTIIAAAIGPDGTWIGADGIAINGDLVTTTSERKINVGMFGKWAFGSSGEVTYDRAVMGPEKPIWPEATGEQGVKELAERMRSRLHDLPGFEPVKDDGCAFRDYRFSPLVACAGRVWRINSCLRAWDGPIEDVFQAAGIGVEFAIGAMSALKAAGEESSEVLVRSAIETCVRRCHGCGGEIQMVRMAP
jgi:hypothetical protein